MEIIVGSIPPLKAQGQKLPPRGTPAVDAKLLHVRPPRKGIAGPSGMERRNKQAKDPHNGRVLTIMVSDARLLPSDIDTAKYDVSLHFIRR